MLTIMMGVLAIIPTINHYQPYQHITIHQPEKICETMLVSLFFANFAVVFPVDWVWLIWIYLDPLEICSIKIAIDYHHLTIIAHDINIIFFGLSQT